jgi:hypothetical protein
LVQSSSIGLVLGSCGILNLGKLHKSIVFLHVDPHNFPKRREQHFKVFTLGSFCGEVHNEECLARSDVSAAIFFFASDTTISTSELGAELL